MKGFPLPTVTDDTRPFWDACRRHQLVVQRCTACGTFRHPPAPVCWRCRSFAHAWEPASGRGSVFSYAVVQRAFLPEVPVPHTIAVVALDDVPGVRLISNLIDAEPTQVHIGLPVEVVFDDVAPDVTVPRFRPRQV